MYLWRVHALKEQLRRGKLSERDAFAYTLAVTLAYTFASSPVVAENDFPANWNWLTTLVVLGIAAAGTFAAYRANGGRAGRDFLVRYFALTWVVGIRVVTFLLIPVVLLYAALSPDEHGRGGSPMLADLLCVTAVSTAFYWRLAHHMRTIGAPAPAGQAANHAPAAPAG
jgi:hypothetical protein